MLLFRLRESCILLAVLTRAGLMISRSHGFLIGRPARSAPGGRIVTGPEEDRLRTRLFVFERMSEDAIQALGAAQKLAIQYKLTSVNGPTVLAGCVEHPDSSALQRTLRKYKVTGRRLQTTLASQYSTTSGSSSSTTSMGWLAGFKAAEKDEDLPFDASVQRTLRASGKLADQMQSTTIYSHHIILALLEYSGKKPPGEATAADEDNEAWKTLLALNVLDDGVTALQFCETLVSNLQQDDTSKGSSAGRELVTGSGGGASSKTPTLSEVGVDLTQQAAEGLLDPVFGRDNEIRACVRTLIRRRKNCVVLIGDAVRFLVVCCCCCCGGGVLDHSRTIVAHHAVYIYREWERRPLPKGWPRF
jgi:ATP-dependent Clp protease ATP-binding subunit ClpA